MAIILTLTDLKICYLLQKIQYIILILQNKFKFHLKLIKIRLEDGLKRLVSTNGLRNY